MRAGERPLGGAALTQPDKPLLRYVRIVLYVHYYEHKMFHVEHYATFLKREPVPHAH